MISGFVKPGNAVVSVYRYYLSTLTGTPSVSSLPVSVSAELTNHCNLRCPECFSGAGYMKRDRGYMDIDLYRKVVSELNPYVYNLYLYFQGEPMLHPQFFSFVQHSMDLNTTVSTNGHFLSVENSFKLAASGLKKLIISLDGMSETSYSEYRRRGDFNRVVSGIRNVFEAKRRLRSRMKLEIQFLVNKANEHQIPSVRRFAGEVNASLKLKSMQIINGEDIGKWIPDNSRFRRYILNNGEFVLRNSFPGRCARLWFHPVITWDGKVVPCCFDKDAEYVMGDLNKDSFRNIWNSKEYVLFRKRLLTERNSIAICMTCTSGLKGARY